MVSRCSEGQMPGSGETSPNPVFCAMPTHPDHTSAAAGAARTSSGQDRTVPARTGTAEDRSVGPTVPGTAPIAAQATGPGTPRTSGVGYCRHADHPPGMASGCGSPVSAARAVATSLAVARTYVVVAPASLPRSVCPAYARATA